MVLIAKSEPGDAAGLTWEKAGDEGAIEVHPRLAQELLAIPGDIFHIVDKVVKAVEKEVKKVVAPEEAPKAPEEAPTEEVAEAAKAATPKRRTTKE